MLFITALLPMCSGDTVYTPARVDTASRHTHTHTHTHTLSLGDDAGQGSRTGTTECLLCLWDQQMCVT